MRGSGSQKIRRTEGTKLGYSQMIVWIVLIVFTHAYRYQPLSHFCTFDNSYCLTSVPRLACFSKFARQDVAFAFINPAKG
jgi:hypothetical protein